MKQLIRKEEFIPIFMDIDWDISTNFLQSRNWTAVPVPNTLTLIESEWLSNNIFLIYNCFNYLEYSFEFDKDVFLTSLPNSQENIFHSDFLNLEKFVIITNENLDFLYFRNQNNLYHLFCGNWDFIYRNLNCSLEMAKKIFFSYGVNSFDENHDEYFYLQNLWKKYQI